MKFRTLLLSLLTTCTGNSALAQTFNEVVGQEQTVTALQNAIREDRLTHAYIFSGPRGTGKTSIAKIVSKAVNCEHPADGEPCNQCSACQDINNGNFMDVIERL